jgi:nucleoid DNA-binding protein
VTKVWFAQHLCSTISRQPAIAVSSSLARFLPTRLETRMNKAELIDTIAEKANASKAATAILLNATLEAIAEALSKGESVQLIGFGSFSVNERAARTGRNPQTGQELNIAAKNVARFKAGAALATAMNKSKAKTAARKT